MYIQGRKCASTNVTVTSLSQRARTRDQGTEDGEGGRESERKRAREREFIREERQGEAEGGRERKGLVQGMGCKTKT